MITLIKNKVSKMAKVYTNIETLLLAVNDLCEWYDQTTEQSIEYTEFAKAEFNKCH